MTDFRSVRRGRPSPGAVLCTSMRSSIRASFTACGATCITAILTLGCGPADDAGAPPVPIGEVTEITSPAEGRTSTPNLDVAPDGTVLLSWTERVTDSAAAIRYAEWNGTEWGAARTIADGRPFFVNWADFPSVVAIGTGQRAAHWLEREGTGKYAYGVRVVHSNDGGATWSAPATPHGDGLEAEHGFVTLWPVGESAIGAVWLDGRKTAMRDSAKEMTLRTGVLTPTGSAMAVQELELDGRICDCCQTSSAPTRRGRVVVYRDRSAGEIRDIGIVREVDGAWTAPALVHADGWHMTGCPVNGPAVASMGDTVVVAWYTAEHDSARVRVARSVDAGASFAAPVTVDDGQPIGRVHVVLDAAGDALVVWLEQAGEQAEIRARRVDATGQRSASRVVSATAGARASGFPRVARVGETLVFAWTGVADGAGVRVAVAGVR